MKLVARILGWGMNRDEALALAGEDYEEARVKV